MENFGELKHEKMNLSTSQMIFDDPLIKEFFAFCKINGLEERAVELLNEKINKKKLNKNC